MKILQRLADWYDKISDKEQPFRQAVNYLLLTNSNPEYKMHITTKSRVNRRFRWFLVNVTREHTVHVQFGQKFNGWESVFASYPDFWSTFMAPLKPGASILNAKAQNKLSAIATHYSINPRSKDAAILLMKHMRDGDMCAL